MQLRNSTTVLSEPCSVLVFAICIQNNMKNHEAFSSFENIFCQFGQQQASARNVYACNLKCTRWLHTPLKSFYWLKTRNICSTIDNCSGNTVPSVFLIHTNRWSATINDIGISVSTRCTVTWGNWINTDWPNKQTFCKVKHIRRNFYTKWVVKIWF